MALTALIGPVTGLLEKVIPDKNARDKMAHEIATMSDKHAQEIALAQIEVNKMEAQGNWFQSSWRPLCGWTCALALLWHFLGQPVALFFITMFGAEVPALPEFDMSTLMTVLMGMLGLGGLRSFEKTKGVNK